MFIDQEDKSFEECQTYLEEGKLLFSFEREPAQ
jgi:hypothetical protein